jgi:hypothetical protein
MKNRMLISLFLLLAVFMKGQSIFDDFENATCDGNTCSNCAINFINHSASQVGCLPSWFASHGTPNTVGPQTPITNGPLLELKPRLTGQCLNLWWSSSQQNEGAFRTFNFRPQVCYKVSFKVAAASQNDVPSTARFLLKVFGAKNIPPQSSSSPAEAPLPNIIAANKQFIGYIEFPRANLSKTAFTAWQTVTFFFRTTRTDLNQVWLFPEVAGGMLILAIDDFSIEEKCSSNLVLDQTSPVYSGNFTSADLIKVGSGNNSLPTSFATATNTLLKASTQITFSTNTRILTPSNGVSFVAKIEPCVLASNSCATAASNIADNEFFNKESPQYRDKDVQILPNPNTGIFQITVAASEAETEKVFEIYNMLGGIIYQGKFKGNDYNIDISDKPIGNYVVKVKIGDQIQTFKILKQ